MCGGWPCWSGRGSRDLGQSFHLRYRELPGDLISVLRLQHLDLEEVREMAEGVEDGRSLKSIRSLVSKENERMALSTLMGAIEEMLRGYPTTLVEDEETLRELGVLVGFGCGASHKEFKHPSQREQHALMMVYSEKLVLQSVLDLVNEGIQAL